MLWYTYFDALTSSSFKRPLKITIIIKNYSDELLGVSRDITGGYDHSIPGGVPLRKAPIFGWYGSLRLEL